MMFVFSFNMAFAIPGDSCSEPVSLAPDAAVNGSTLGGLAASSPSCGEAVVGAGTWYEVVAPADGVLTLSTCTAAAFDTVISVYSGGCNLVCEGANDDSCGTQSSLDVPVTAGEAYLVLVHGVGGAEGSYTLDSAFVADIEPPIDCTGRTLPVCRLTNRVVEKVNEELRSVVVSETASASRLRPSNIYRKIETIYQTGMDASCFNLGTAGGQYDVSAETWSGSAASQFLGSGPVVGVFDLPSKTAFGAGALGPYGDRFGVYSRRGKVALSGGPNGQYYTMGHWIRTAGRRGVYVELIGSCPQDYRDVFDSWFGGLPNVPPTVSM